MPHTPVRVNHMRVHQTDIKEQHWLSKLSCDPGELNIVPAPKSRLRLTLRCWCQRDPGKRAEGDVHRKHTLILVHRKVTKFFCSLFTLCPPDSFPDPEQWLSEVISGSKDESCLLESLTLLMQPLLDLLIQLNTV